MEEFYREPEHRIQIGAWVSHIETGLSGQALRRDLKTIESYHMDPQGSTAMTGILGSDVLVRWGKKIDDPLSWVDERLLIPYTPKP